MPYWLLIVITLAVFIILWVLRSRTTKPPTRLIVSPVLGVLNILGSGAEASIEQDRAAIATFFSKVIPSTDGPPHCDVLLLYCDIEPSGRIRECDRRLPELIQRSGAIVAIVASNNTIESYTAGTAGLSGNINLVLTLDRRGEAFGNFFGHLFAEMKRGVAMPVAWVKLAPQIPGATRNAPALVFHCGAGQVAFG